MNIKEYLETHRRGVPGYLKFSTRPVLDFQEEASQRKAQAEADAEVKPDPVDLPEEEQKPKEEKGLGLTDAEIETLANDAFARMLEDPDLMSDLKEKIAGLFDADEEDARLIDGLMQATGRLLRACIKEKVQEGITLERAQALVDDCKTQAKASAEAFIAKAAEEQGAKQQAPAAGASPAEGMASPGFGLPGLPTPSIGGVTGLSSSTPILRYMNRKAKRFNQVEPEPQTKR